jgi:diacylglycerol kinase (ATP)
MSIREEAVAGGHGEAGVHTETWSDKRWRALVIFNPNAGRRRRKTFEKVCKALRECGFDLQIGETGKSGDAEALASVVAPGSCDLIIVAGGDGTVNEVLNGLGGCSLPLAIVPIGTANVLAAELCIDPDVKGLCRVIAFAQTNDIWLAQANGRYFSMMAGVGFDAHVIARVEAKRGRYWSKSRLGKAAYVFAACRELIQPHLNQFRVEIDGVEHLANSVIVANGRYYAGRFVCASEARLHDRSLHACLLQGDARRHFLLAAIALICGRFESLRNIKVVRGQHITVSGPDSEAFHCDGDIAGQLPVTITAGAAQASLIVT